MVGYPQHWLDSAIPYGQLKKLLKKVQRELNDFGLDSETMRQLLAAETVPSPGEPVAMAKYHLDRTCPHHCVLPPVQFRACAVQSIDVGFSAAQTLKPYIP